MPTQQLSQTLRIVPMISSSDIEAALTLYRDELGFVVTNSFPKEGKLIWCQAKVGTTELMFQCHPRAAAKNGGTVFYVYVTDVDSLREVLVAKGYTVGVPETCDGRRECDLVDRDGNTVMLCQVLS